MDTTALTLRPPTPVVRALRIKAAERGISLPALILPALAKLANEPAISRRIKRKGAGV